MLFNSTFFCKLAVLKKHSLRLVFLELSVLRKPALRQYFFRLCDMASKITLRNKLHDFEWIKKKLNPDQKCVKTRSEFIFCLTDWIYHGLDLKTDFWHHITNGICAWKQFNASKSLCWKNSDWKSYAKSFRKNFWILAFWNFNCVNKFALDF